MKSSSKATTALRFALLGSCLFAVSCSNPPAPPRPPERPDARVLAPPTRPERLVAQIALGRPRETVATLGRLIGMRLPLELGLGLLGFDSVVLAASDTNRPVTATVLGDGRAEDVVFVLVPASQSGLRSALGARYRFTANPSLGDVLDLREAATRPRERRLRCAIVGVPDPAMPSRIACARKLELLQQNGRWAAYESVRATRENDAEVNATADGMRRVLLPMAQFVLTGIVRSMSASAAEERRAHPTPPDFGDPEAVVGLLERAIGELGTMAGGLGESSITVRFDQQNVAVDVRSAMDPSAQTSLVRDALARERVALEHPLGARLAPDSAIAVVERTSAERHRGVLGWVSERVLDILGSRVPDRAAALTDLRALFSQTDEGLAVGLAFDANTGPELTLLLQQSDAGANATAVLNRVGRAAWLRGIRFGTAAPRITPRPGMLVLQAPPSAPAPAPAAGTAPSVAAMVPRTAVVSVANETLSVIVGRRAETSMAGLRVRTGTTPPAVLARAREASLYVGLLSDAQQNPVELGYRVQRQGDHLEGHLRLRASEAALSALRAMMNR